MKKVRLCIIGSHNSGKTSLVQRWCRPLHPIDPPKTIGIDMRSMVFDLERDNIIVQFWDCSGDESFQALLEPYLNNTELVIICFELTSAQSWLRAQFWIDKTMETCKTPICIIGNKLDRESERVIRQETLNRYIRSIVDRNAFYCETSAYTGENCKKTLKMCIRESLRQPVHYTVESLRKNKENSCILM